MQTDAAVGVDWDEPSMNRRQAILSLGFASRITAAPPVQPFCYVSQGTVFTMGADGARELRFEARDVATWQAGPAFSDGQRQLMVGWESGPVFKGTVPSHIWISNVVTGKLIQEAFVKNRLAPHYAPVTLLPGDERALVSVIVDGKGRLFNIRLDGSAPTEVATPPGGFSYGFAVNPGGNRLAFHTTGPRPLNYRIIVANLDGSDPVTVASQPEHLYFGPVWSPDGSSIFYLDCLSAADPGHDWADLCISAATGHSHRVVTEGQCLWFASSYGVPGNRGNGSIIPEWSPDGSAVLVNRKLPGSRPPWEFQAQRPDTDHFNRDYHPERARGGTQLSLLDRATGRFRDLTKPEEGEWNWGGRFTKSGERVIFHRARVGETPGIWIMRADGSEQRLLTRGKDGQGAIFSRWMAG